MEQVLLVVQLIVTIGLIGMVLLQRSDSDGFGLGSGGNSNFLSGRASANLMTRTTAILAAVFILNSLVLSVMAAHNKPASIVDAIKAAEEKGALEALPPADAPKKDRDAKASKPAVPTAGAEAPAMETPSADALKPAKKTIKKAKPVEAPTEEE